MENLLQRSVRLVPLLSPKSSQVNNIAKKHRGPKRYLGYTKSQILDRLMASHAGIWMLFGAAALPATGYWVYHLKSKAKAIKSTIEDKEEELLSEGRYEKN